MISVYALAINKLKKRKKLFSIFGICFSPRIKYKCSGRTGTMTETTFPGYIGHQWRDVFSVFNKKNQKNPLNATMRKSYTPVENWDTEILYDFRNDTGYQPAESEWKTQPPHPGTQINQTWILQSKEYCLEGWLCGTAKAGPALESREQRMKGK